MLGPRPRRTVTSTVRRDAPRNFFERDVNLPSPSGVFFPWAVTLDADDPGLWDSTGGSTGGSTRWTSRTLRPSRRSRSTSCSRRTSRTSTPAPTGSRSSCWGGAARPKTSPRRPWPALRAVAQGPGLRRGVGRAGRRQPGDRHLATPAAGRHRRRHRRRVQPRPDPTGSASTSTGHSTPCRGRQREVLVLRFLADLPEADVAKALGCSVGSVKQHASRGLATLRTTLGVDDAGETQEHN